MRVENIQLTAPAVGESELSAEIDGFRLWYRVPAGTPLSARGDPWLAAALLPAMRRGEKLHVGGAPVSPRLLAGVARLQRLYHAWDENFHLIDVEASEQPAVPLRPQTGAFFSGGVDGTFSFACHRDEIDELIFVHGVDMQLDNEEQYREVLASNRAFAARHGKTLLPLTSNIRAFCGRYGLRWGRNYSGAGLASFALALGLPRVYIAASTTAHDLNMSGTHPLLDPLWSSEATELVHDGIETGRGEKLWRIATLPGVLDILRVCWHDAGYNCGRCEKCLRTMIALSILDLPATRFPPEDGVEAARRYRIMAPQDVLAVEDNLQLARKYGKHDIAAILDAELRRYRFRRALRNAVDAGIDWVARRPRR